MWRYVSYKKKEVRLIINLEVSVKHLDVGRGGWTDHCFEAELQMCRWTHFLMDGSKWMHLLPVSTCHLLLTSHCANTAGNVGWERVRVCTYGYKRQLEWASVFNQSQDSTWIHTCLTAALEMVLKWNSSKLCRWLQCVYVFFPPQGEYNILLFLCLDSESESAQTGALGSHGSCAPSQATSQSVCRLVSWCAWAEAYSRQHRVR